MTITDNSQLPVEVQTDKTEHKVVPCTICQRPLQVNRFYAPAKARCEEHRGQASHAIRKAVQKPVQQQEVSSAPVVPNGNLRDLRCPFCEESMEIILIDDGVGFIDFHCRQCRTGISVKPQWGPMMMKRIPERLQPVVAEFNLLPEKERMSRIAQKSSWSNGRAK